MQPKITNKFKNLLDNANLIVHNNSEEPCPAFSLRRTTKYWFLKTEHLFFKRV